MPITARVGGVSAAIVATECSVTSWSSRKGMLWQLLLTAFASEHASSFDVAANACFPDSAGFAAASDTKCDIAGASVVLITA